MTFPGCGNPDLMKAATSNYFLSKDVSDFLTLVSFTEKIVCQKLFLIAFDASKNSELTI